MNELIREKLNNLKPLPGCYLMKNSNGNVIYVGKAIKLNNRVKSYFFQKHTGKTAKLVSEIEDFDFIITGSDREAFLLEINLIHQYNPVYNILLKDGKAYPYIELVLDEHPHLRIARSIKNKKNKYFGPYTSSFSAYQTLDLLNRIYPLRKCFNIPSKSCLYYHMNQCLGPCVNDVSSSEYSVFIDKIISFLNGNIDEERKNIENKMKKESDELRFEEAQKCKELIEALDHISLKQTIVDPSLKDVDIFGYHSQDNYLSISTLIYRNGILRFKNNRIIEMVDDESSTLLQYIIQYYSFNIIPNEIIVPTNLDKEYLEESLNTKISSYSKGKRHELEMKAAQNAFEGMNEKYLIVKSQEEKTNDILENISKITGVKNIHTIELIDNSHINGADAVSSVVVFKDLKPVKQLYRKYNLNNLNTKDDLEGMKEVIYRRYYRKLTENIEMSDLIIVDGGINQIKAAKESLNNLDIDISVIGLKKDNAHNTSVIVLDDGSIVNIKDDKDLYFMLAKMQDEVHKNVINFHISKRSKRMNKSILDNIEGLGNKRQEKLLSIYSSIDEIRKASIEELSQYIPLNVANALYKYLKNNN